jgi:hypothetical protein
LGGNIRRMTDDFRRRELQRAREIRDIAWRTTDAEASSDLRRVSNAILERLAVNSSDAAVDSSDAAATEVAIVERLKR